MIWQEGSGWKGNGRGMKCEMSGGKWMERE